MSKKIGDLVLYSVDDLHELLGISKMTLRAYLREGRIKGKKLGVSWYVTEDAIRRYFEEPNDAISAQSDAGPDYKYIVQGVNDLVSETVECESATEALNVLQSQPIISLFQVQVIDKNTSEIMEIIKARDFLEKYDKI